MKKFRRVVSLPNISEIESKQRERRKTSYHLVATKNVLPEDPEEEDDLLYKYLLTTTARKNRPNNHLRIQEVKRQLVLEIARTGGSVDTPQFQRILDELLTLHDPSQIDARVRPKKEQEDALEGMWITLSKQPKFPDCVGKSSTGDFMYTLGNLSFDLLKPNDLVCTVHGTFNPIRFVKDPYKLMVEEGVPKSLISEFMNNNSVVRTYQIVTPFAIEPYHASFGPNSPNFGVDHAIEGLLTTRGFVVADPSKPNRLSIWFTGGSIEVRDAETAELRNWQRLFTHCGSSKATSFEGMEDDGKMSYQLNPPVGGHDEYYVDLLYLDETLRVVRANNGSVHVMARVPYFPNE